VSRIITSLWLLLAVTTCVAQNERGRSNKQPKPDLSGAWVLDKSRSDKVEYSLTLNIVHREPEIRITKSFVEDGRARIEESVYYTDGRGEPATVKLEHIFKPVTEWRGKALVREYVHMTKGTRFEILTTEQWKLSKDGLTLTHTVVNRQNISTNVTIFPRLEKKYVFTRTD
jgi:hypothetical protein